ncbi:MAG: ribosome silencing factor [Chloroflexi bacterium]|nr:ribosome silencing factor [Chloroflexota bacterium]
MDVASEKQATNIVLLDLREVCSFTDYFLICEGETERHLESLSQEIEKNLAQEGISLHHREGTPSCGWLLLDYGSLVVHIFAAKERGYYQLDSLWSDATPLVRIQ